MRYFISFLIGIGLIVLVFILILKSFSGGGTNPTAKPLVNYANTTTTVQMTISGPITANQTHNEVRINVGRDQNTIALIQGYDNDITKSAQFANTSVSYASFLRALDLAGYTKGNTSTSASDERGYCPLGDRYIFEVLNGASDVERFWSTSCGQGNFKGNTTLVKTLFTKQIPQYDQFIGDAKV